MVDGNAPFAYTSCMPLQNLIGWQVRRIRIAQGMTIPDLCRRLKGASISPEEFILLETRSRKVLDYEIKAIAEVLGVQSGELFRTRRRNVQRSAIRRQR